MKKYFSFCVLVLVVLNFGCKEENNPVVVDNLPPFLYGEVVDDQGNPIDGVGFHYLFNTEPTPSYKLSKTCPSTLIQFSIPTRTHVSLKVYRWYTLDTIRTLIDDTLDAGTLSANFDVTNLTNGTYICRLVAGTYTEEKRMQILNLDISVITASTPLTFSNSSGLFSVPNGVFGIGLPAYRTDGGPSIIDTVYISRNIQVVLHKAGYQTLIQPLSIDTTKGIKQVFRLYR